MTRRPVKPKNWEALFLFGKALKRFSQTRDWSEVSPSELAELAEIIKAIAMGADAREKFGQKGAPGNQPQDAEKFTRALVYWKARAEEPANVRRAVEIAQRHFSSTSAPNRQTIERNARRYRESILKFFDSGGLVDGAAIDTKALHAHLAVKNHRGRF